MAYSVAIITLSDKGFRGERVDLSGPAIKEMLEATGLYEVVYAEVLSDDKESLKGELIRLSDEEKVNLILTTGGTGLSPRDNAPEATKEIMTRDCPGFSEYMRMKSCEVTTRGMLSRGASVIRNSTLIINLPGSVKAVKENLDFILEPLKHGLDILLGLDSECGNVHDEKQ